MKRYSRINCFVPLTCLILVFDNILLLQLSHPLDFIEVYYEALFVSMLWLDTLSTENREMVGTIEMLHPFRMYRAKFLTKHFFILVIEIKGSLIEYRILLNNFIQNVDVQWKSLSTFKLLDQLSADGASNPVLVVQFLNAAGA